MSSSLWRRQGAKRHGLFDSGTFAHKFHLNLPTVEELQMELMRERAAIEEAMALRALPPPEAGRHSAPRKTSKGGK